MTEMHLKHKFLSQQSHVNTIKRHDDVTAAPVDF